MVGRRRFKAVAVLAAALFGLVLASPIPASGAEQEAPEGLSVIAYGLDNPRGLHLDNRGRVYVAEAGRGGDTLVSAALGAGPGPVCVGNTGRVSRITDSGMETLITAPSAAPAVDGSCEGAGAQAIGPQGVSSQGAGRQLTYSLGVGGTPGDRATAAASLPEAHYLGWVRHTRRPAIADVDLAEFEATVDPSGDGVDSNPYGLMRIGREATVVADAGGNSLLKLRRDGVSEVLAVFPFLCMPWTLGENPIPPEANPCGDSSLFPADAVPTDVARHRSGDYLVSVLGGFPFVPGESFVFRVDRDHEGVAVCSSTAMVPASGCEVFAGGLTSLVGIDVDRTGKVYALQYSDAGVFGAGAVPGSVRVLHGGTGEEIGALTGIQLPGGIATRAGKVYVTANSIGVGTGQVLEGATHCNQPSLCPQYWASDGLN